MYLSKLPNVFVPIEHVFVEKAINEYGQHFLFYGQVKEDIDPFSRFELSRKVSTFCRIKLTAASRSSPDGICVTNFQ